MVSYDRKAKEALKYFISIFLNEMMGFSFGNVLSAELPYAGASRRLKNRGIKTFRGLNDVIQLHQMGFFPLVFISSKIEKK